MNIKDVVNRRQTLFYVMLFSLVVFTLFPKYTKAADRFAPPSFNIPINSFNNRFNTDNFNVEFLVADVLNNVRQTQRKTGEEIDNNTKSFINQSNGSDSNIGAISNSVVVPVGVKVETIIVINQNEGDSYAIQR